MKFLKRIWMFDRDEVYRRASRKPPVKHGSGGTVADYDPFIREFPDRFQLYSPYFGERGQSLFK